MWPELPQLLLSLSRDYVIQLETRDNTVIAIGGNYGHVIQTFQL